MNKNILKIFISIIILSGIFCSGFAYDQFDFKNENNRFYVAQLAFLMMSAGLLGSALIYNFNRWIAWLGVALSFGCLKTFLLANAPKVNMFESVIIGFCAFIIYYFVRKLEYKEDVLKWFLIPAGLNILVVLIQAFDHYPLFFLYVKGISGLIGAEGMTAAYLALTLPLFFKYCRWGVVPCFLVIILCNGAIGLMSGILGMLFYLFHAERRFFRMVVLLTIMLSEIFILSPKFSNFKSDMRLRVSMFAGTLDGIKHNPVLGWGIGSFIPTIAQIPPEDTEFLGRRFNTEGTIMNHPHNELLSGWWKIGIAFPILAIAILINFMKKFKKEYLMTYTIVMIGVLISLGWFFTLPALFLLITTFAIHENQFKGGIA